MTIEEFLKADSNSFEEVFIYKNNDNTYDNLIAHLDTNTKTIIERYGQYEIKQFWVCSDNCEYYFVFIV